MQQELAIVVRQSAVDPPPQVTSLGGQVKVTGVLEVIIYDDFDNGRAWMEYSLRADDGNRYLLTFSKPPRIRSGVRLSIHGTATPEGLAVSQYTVVADAIPAVGNPNLGEQSTVVLLVNFLDDTSEPITSQEAWNRVFDENNVDSINSYIKEVSYEQTFLAGQAFPATGWYPIPLNSADFCAPGGFVAVRAAAIEEADPEVNFMNFSRLIIVLPNYAGCGSSAGGTQEIMTDDGLASLSTAILANPAQIIAVGAHEFGHMFFGNRSAVCNA